MQDLKLKQCKHCYSEFEYKRKTAEFCKESCKKMYKAQRQRKLQKKRLYRAETSAFFYYLADECRRAETVEILQSHTLESMQALHAVYKYRMKANGYGSETTYSLCHLFPVKHVSRIGVLRAENLVVSYSTLNSKHSNTSVAGIGVSIPRLGLSPKWKVSETATKTAVIKLVVEYLGTELVETLAIKLKLQSTVRQQVFDFLCSSEDPRIPAITKLEEMSTQELSSLKAEITGKGARSFRDYALDSTFVFKEELTRLSQYRPELLKALEFWEEHHWDFTELQYNPTDKKEYAKLQAAQFDLLHGGKVSAFLEALNTLLGHTVPESTPVESTPVAKPVNTDDWLKELDREYEELVSETHRVDTPAAYIPPVQTPTYYDPPPF